MTFPFVTRSPIRILGLLAAITLSAGADEPLTVIQPNWSSGQAEIQSQQGANVATVTWSGKTGAIQLSLAEPLDLGSAHRLVIRVKKLSGMGPIQCTFLLTDGQNRAFTYVAGELSTDLWQRLSAWPFGIPIRTPAVGVVSWHEMGAVPAPPYRLTGISFRGPSAASLQIGTIEVENVPRSQLPGYWGILPLPDQKGASYYEFSAGAQLYADRLVQKSGHYRVILEASTQFNGPSVWQQTKEFDYDPDSLPSGVPLDLPPGTYWISARIYAADQYLEQKSFFLDLHRGGTGVPLQTPEKISTLQIGPNKATPASPSWPISIPPATPSDAVLNYQITDLYGKTVLDSGQVPITAATVLTPAKALAGGDVYLLSCSLQQNARKLDEASLLFFVPEKSAADEAGPVAVIPDKRPDPNGPAIMEFAIVAYWQNYRLGDAPPPLSEIEDLIQLAKEKKFSEIRIGLDWAALEPLPGAFRFREVDALVKAIKAAGLNVSFEVYGFYNVTIPHWLLSCDLMTNQEGEVDNLWKQSSVSLVPSPADPMFLKALGDFYHAFACRYRSDPSVVGYTFSGMFADHFYSDNRLPFGMLDYSPASQKAFQDMLRETYGNSIANLNAKYHSTFSSFEEARLPEPQAATIPPTPDFRPEWIDFIAYRKSLFLHYVNVVFDAVRACDTKCWLQFYRLGGEGSESAIDILKARGGFVADGGDEGEDDIMVLSHPAYLSNMKEATESVVQMPMNRYDIDMIFTRLYYGGNGASYRVLWNMGVARDQAKKDACLDCISYLSEIWKPILDRLKITLAPKLDFCVMDAVPQSAMSYLHSYEANQGWGAAGLTGALLKDHLYPYWIDEYAPLSALDDAKLTILNADMTILPAARLDRLVQWVQDGGKLVTSISGGRWALEHPEQDFYMLHQLGLQVNLGEGRHLDKEIAVASGDTFRSPHTLTLNAAGIDGAPGAVETTVTGDVKVEATFSDGSPAVLTFHYGKGEVLLFLQSIDWHKVTGTSDDDNILGDLSAWAGCKRFFSSDQPEFYLSLVHDASSQFLLVHRYMPYGTISNPTSFNLAQPRLSGAVQVLNLEPNQTFEVRDMTNPATAPLETNGSQMSTAGLTVNDMVLGETRVFQISPVTPK